MKQHILLCLLSVITMFRLLAQPIMTNGVSQLNLDGIGNIELVYRIGAQGGGSGIVIWDTGFAIEPWGQQRLLRSTLQRVWFAIGEDIDSSRSVFQKDGGFDMLLLSYRAISEDDGATWTYSTLTPAFETRSDLLLGLKLTLPTGTHYGWIRFTRPVVDKHTPFEITGWAYHPIPGEPIPAGEPPPLPPLQTVVDTEGFTFSWDPRWGELVLETAVSLEPPVQWEPVVQSAGGPVTMPMVEEDQRFYRLRTP